MATISIPIPDSKVGDVRAAVASQTGGAQSDAQVIIYVRAHLASLVTDYHRNRALRSVATETLE